MPDPITSYQLNEPQLLAKVSQLTSDLRMLRLLLQMEQQQALIANDSAKRAAIKQAFTRRINTKSNEQVVSQLEAIREGKVPWVPAPTRPKGDVLHDIDEVVSEGSRLGHWWGKLLRSYGVASLPANPLFNQ
ncbi:hypothetical protein GKZ68_20525 (plasmid) [Hymenobacter sp. BRD128]|uniref:hypothetical protein n=1 Tax=Hymenobacter sp. BRD128 TaxID=2675878 RepID=UPI0015678935|nr:hypothetical protein [Hymenobacter sp. BRD128]QKG59070.1 hypothetical protein GKZ68_20525 [Hymenobacter sp. BRD128]